MRVLIIHNRYQVRGGEDKVVEQEGELLSSHGHDVAYLQQDNEHIQGFFSKVMAAKNLIYSRKSYERTREAIDRHEPDIVHAHNLFPTLTPSVLVAAKSCDLPVVMTLHNFRLICPSAILFINGRIDETSVLHGPYAAARKRAYRNSLLGSFAVARLIQHHRTRGTWDSEVDRFITLTEFQKSMFHKAGFDTEKFRTKPNFIADPHPSGLPASERNGALFVGRLSAEKGVDILLGAWEKLDIPLTIVGPGTAPITSSVNRAIQFAGELPYNEISQLMLESQFLVLPSICYEGFPMVLIEALAHGLPILASNIGALPDIVTEGVIGQLATAGDPDAWSRRARDMSNADLGAMSSAARREFTEKYTATRNYEQLIQIYEDAHYSRRS